jgi:hypothetical protein
LKKLLKNATKKRAQKHGRPANTSKKASRLPKVVEFATTRPTNVPENAKPFENGNIKIWWDGTNADDYNSGQPVDPATGKPIQ